MVEDVVLACDAVDGSAGVMVTVGENGEQNFEVSCIAECIVPLWFGLFMQISDH